jgi:hypothetical protein
MKKKLLAAVVIFLLVVGSALGIVCAQNKKIGEPPLAKYLEPKTITEMDWLLKTIEIEEKIAMMGLLVSSPETQLCYLKILAYDHNDNKISAYFLISTDKFEKLTMVEKKEVLSKSLGGVFAFLEPFFREFKKQRDFKATFSSWFHEDVLVAEYIDGELKIVK